MNKLRRIHLYIGCLFAPMLIFFALSGAWQTLGLGGRWKAPLPEKWRKLNNQLASLTSAHVHTRDPFTEFQEGKIQEFKPFAFKKADPYVLPYSLFMVLMALGLIATTLIGVIMAFKYAGNSKLVFVYLFVGILLPLLLLYLRGLQWKYMGQG